MMWPCVLVCGGLLVGSASMVGAQNQEAARGTLVGVVLDADGRGLGDVDVIMGQDERRTRSDSLGRFLLRDLPVGRATLRVRRIGYRPLEQRIAVRAGEQDVVVELLRYAQAMDTVRVFDQHACDPTSLAGFECRRRAGVGYFRDAGEIRALRATDMADLFDGVPGIRRQFERDGPHGGEFLPVPVTSRCMVRLWNGQPEMERGASLGKGDVTWKPDRIWRPQDIVALEVYDVYAKVPERYRGAAWPADSPQPCVLVIYWTRGAAKR
ncbi:carboxypeptidase-like regulatory domain-containing protein [Gemmatimonas sp. UBA7669]|uniref:carboxypeptidase-like regulatory domain-containing protein n=1 Tax=Gemmatimonas sp. UBA7669 TaxID=1946568 RepID=UPI0025BB1ADE|nr:carboxypeptidase-like regulatory domain-containing protein [Gemmatimonas sp. UBA7669]